MGLCLRGPAGSSAGGGPVGAVDLWHSTRPESCPGKAVRITGASIVPARYPAAGLADRLPTLGLHPAPLRALGRLGRPADLGGPGDGTQQFGQLRQAILAVA